MRIPSKLVLPALGALLLIGSRLAGQQSSTGIVPVTSQMLQEPDPADWLMWRRTLNSWGYSPLRQIDRLNGANLKMVWTRGMGPGVQEATPLVYKGVMYLPNPSDYIQAIDAATGDLKWEYKRKLPDDLNKFLIVPSINRNLAIYENMIIDTSADDFVFALDAQTGKLIWENRIVDYREDSAQGDFRTHHRRRQRLFRAAAANTRPRRMATSSLRTTARPARSCGGHIPSHVPANPATKPGATSPMKSGTTSEPG